MNDNKLSIAAAGSGKTTYLVEEARRIKETRVLITELCSFLVYEE